jgi:hypothetical protein
MPIGADPTRGTPGTFRGGPALMRALGLAGVALILELLAAAGLALLEEGGGPLRGSSRSAAKTATAQRRPLR